MFLTTVGRFGLQENQQNQKNKKNDYYGPVWLANTNQKTKKTIFFTTMDRFGLQKQTKKANKNKKHNIFQYYEPVWRLIVLETPGGGLQGMAEASGA